MVVLGVEHRLAEVGDDAHQRGRIGRIATPSRPTARGRGPGSERGAPGSRGPGRSACRRLGRAGGRADGVGGPELVVVRVARRRTRRRGSAGRCAAPPAP